MISKQLLDQHEPGLFDRFVQLAEKYQYRDLGRAVADAIRAWVETHERSDTGRPPPVSPDATLQESEALNTDLTPPPPLDDEDTGPPTSRK
jgi:hypothetical protein